MAVSPGFDAAALFQFYVARNMHFVSQRVQAQAPKPPAAEDLEMALHALAFALDERIPWPVSRQALLVLAPKMEQAGLRHEWLHYLELGLQRSQDQQDVEAEAELRCQLGIVLHLLARYEQARQALELSIRAFEVLGDRQGWAKASNRLAYVARRQGRWQEAETLAAQVLATLAADDPERAYCFLVLGAVRLDQRRWQEAVHYFQASLDYWQRYQDSRDLAWSLSNLGLAQWRNGDLTIAASTLRRAIEVFDRVQDPVHQAVAAMNLGGVHQALGQPAEALACYRRAEPVLRGAGESERLARLYNNMGMAYRALGEWQAAQIAYQESIRLWQTLDNPRRLANAIGGLGLVYLDQTHHAAAAATLAEAIAVLAALPADPERDALLAKIAAYRQQASSAL